MTGQPSLFDTLPAVRRGQRQLRETAAKHQHEIDRLVPLARSLARWSTANGVTVADLRVEAVKRKLLTGDERGRQLSWLGGVMKAAGLVNTGEYRRSHLERSNGNLQAIWRAP